MTIWMTYKGLIDEEKDRKLTKAMRNLGCQRLESAFSLHSMKRSIIFECASVTADTLEKVDWSKHNLEIEVIPV